MRLIDADAADVNEICCFYGSECGLEDVEEWLNEQPTIDAEPVRRGQWDSENRCTVCGHLCATVTLKDGTRLHIRTPYCPGCGAKMDGGAKDGD